MIGADNSLFGAPKCIPLSNRGKHLVICTYLHNEWNEIEIQTMDSQTNERTSITDNDLHNDTSPSHLSITSALHMLKISHTACQSCFISEIEIQSENAVTTSDWWEFVQFYIED